MSTFEHVPFAAGEPTRDPTYPIPPPGEYYATAKWVKELVDSTVARVDPGNVRAILDELLATWDPSFAMKKPESAVEYAIAVFDRHGQIYGSDMVITDVIARLEAAETSAAASAAAVDVKVDKEKGKGLSSNDFTDALKEKLENVSGSLTVDGTLTVPGVAADAEATGRNIGFVRSAVTELSMALNTLNESTLPGIGGRLNEIGEAAQSARELAAAAQASANAANETLGSLPDLEEIADVKAALEGKADADAVEELRVELDGKVSTDALDTALATKADADAVTALDASLKSKADATELSTLQTTVDGKANQTDLETLANKVEAMPDATTFETRLSSKRDLNDLNVIVTVGGSDGSDEEEPVTQKTQLATLLDLGKYRLSTDLSFKKEDGSSTDLITRESLEAYLKEHYENAETTYYGG